MSTTSSRSAHCPVCATEVATSPRYCERCGTPHHEECWSWAGGCAIYACTTLADETKVPPRTASDLDLVLPFRKRGPGTQEALPLSMFVAVAVALPLITMVWPMAALILIGVVCFANSRRWKIDPSAGTLESSASILGFTVHRHVVPLSQVRRFEVRKSDQELTLIARLEEGASLAISVNRLTAAPLVESLEGIIEGIRCHTSHQVLRYLADDPASLPKRVEQLRMVAANAGDGSWPSVLAVLGTTVLLFLCSRSIGDTFVTLALVVHFLVGIGMIVWPSLSTFFGGRPTLDATRVSTLENQLWHGTSAFHSGWKIFFATLFLAGIAVYNESTKPAGWGWIFLATLLGFSIISWPIVWSRWVVGCLRHGVPAKDGTPPGAKPQNIAFVVMLCCISLQSQVRMNQDRHDPDAILITEIGKVWSGMGKHQQVLEQALVGALGGQVADPVALEQVAREAEKAERDFRLEADARELSSTALSPRLEKVSREFREQYAKLAKSLAALPENIRKSPFAFDQSDHLRRILVETGDYRENGREFAELLRIRGGMYNSSFRLPPKVHTALSVSEISWMVHRAWACRHPLDQMISRPQAAPYPANVWQQACRDTRVALASVLIDLDALNWRMDPITIEMWGHAREIVLLNESLFQESEATLSGILTTPGLGTEERNAKLATWSAPWKPRFVKAIQDYDGAVAKLQSLLLAP